MDEPVCHCPHCGAGYLDLPGVAESEGVTPGVLTLCIRCRRPLRFGADFTLQAVDEATLSDADRRYLAQASTFLVRQLGGSA